MKRSTLIICAIGTLALAPGLSCVDTSLMDEPVDPELKQDNDEDGFSKNEGDCDDNDRDIYPGAPEKQDCIDNDCDGKIDEGTPNEDKDGDKYCPSTGDKGNCEGNIKRNPGMSEDGGTGTKLPNKIDDNCNGLVDEGLPTSDMDNDKYTVLDGDCNDDDAFTNPGAVEVEGMTCSTAAECPIGKCYGGYCRCVNNADCSSKTACKTSSDCTMAGETCKSGKCSSTFLCMTPQTGLTFPALKVCRDGVDNDCDGKKDELPTPCDDPTKLNKNTARDYAKAMELCDTDIKCGIEKACPGSLACVGGYCSRVISAKFNSSADSRAHNIAKEFAQSGPFIPRVGKSFAVLSSGLADYDPNSTSTCPQGGTQFTSTAPDPDPTATDKQAYDYIELALEIVVPSNAQSFQFDFHFFSAEYPDYVGTQYNDTFWVDLTSKQFNGNISFDKNGVPIRINNAFFSMCDPYPSKPQTLKMCTKPASSLKGTGYYTECCPYCPGGAAGGSTDWLFTKSPVTPNEKITLVFSIFDKGDRVLDSAVLIDNFRWKLAPAKKPITGPG